MEGQLSRYEKGLVIRQEHLKSLLMYVESKGGVVIDPRPVVKNDRVLVRCKERHEWEVTVGSLLTQGTWCPRCAGNSQRTLEELETIVKSRGGVLKTKEYRGVDGSYDFECNLGHSFTNRFKKIENGQWCPICSKGSKSEEIARTTLEQLFGEKFPKKKPKWLRNSRGYQMELDGYNEELMLAFEYQGIQHFQENHWGSDVVQRREDDELKQKLCSQKGIVLIELTHEHQYLDFPEEIRKQLTSANYQAQNIDFEKPIDLSKAYIRNDRIEELRDLLASKQIRLLSNAWIGSNQKYEMECQVCGHHWFAAGNSFFNSRKISGCDYCSRREPANKQDLNVLIQYAASHDGQLISTEYVRRNHTYEWQCRKGHLFEANFNNLMFREQFCPVCESRTLRSHLSQAEAEEKFNAFGYLLVDRYKDNGTYCKVQCQSCGNATTKSLERLNKGIGKCRGCELKNQEVEALELLKQRKLKPLEQFAGNSHKWRCECLVCHEIVTPRVSNIKKGQGACINCYLRSRKENSD